MRFTILLTALLLPPLAAAQVYKWVDSEGNTHYSQTPPSEQAVEKLRLYNTKSISDEESEKQRKAQEAIFDRKPQDPEAQKRADEEAAANQENCTRARDNLANLEKMAGRRTRDAEGNVSYLPEEQRQQQMATAREQIKKFCH